MDETRGAAGMAEVREVLKDWDLVTDELAARNITTDPAWTVLQLVAQNRMAAALERLTGIQGGQLNREMLVPHPSGMRVHPDLAHPAQLDRYTTGAMTSAQMALVLQVRDSLRDLLKTYPSRVAYEDLAGMLRYLNVALGDEVEPDEDPRR